MYIKTAILVDLDNYPTWGASNPNFRKVDDSCLVTSFTLEAYYFANSSLFASFHWKHG